MTTQRAVTYLDGDAAVTRFVEALGPVRDLAVDTEGASFHRFVDRIYLLQLSTRERHAIIDPLRVATPAPLGRLLEDPAVQVVFHDADYDLRLLHQDYGWHVRNVFDTRIAAQLLGVRQFGLAALLEQEFGVRLDKKHQRADWSMRPLPAEMLAYAAQDTRHLLALRDVLADRLARRGRAHWAAEEFQRLEGLKWPAEDPADAYLRLKGARDLTRRELAVLRELVVWRDATARAMDRATFRVVANETLLDLARRQPTTVEALKAVKGMPRGIAESRAAELIAAIERGLAVPEKDLPRFPRPPRWDKDPDFDARVGALRSVRDVIAADLDLDPGVLCARERIEAVARKRPRDAEELAAVEELRGWQREVLGDGFLRALAS